MPMISFLCGSALFCKVLFLYVAKAAVAEVGEDYFSLIEYIESRSSSSDCIITHTVSINHESRLVVNF